MSTEHNKNISERDIYLEKKALLNRLKQFEPDPKQIIYMANILRNRPELITKEEYNDTILNFEKLKTETTNSAAKTAIDDAITAIRIYHDSKKRTIHDSILGGRSKRNKNTIKRTKARRVKKNKTSFRKMR
jgi:hypothetical protein